MNWYCNIRIIPLYIFIIYIRSFTFTIYSVIYMSISFYICQDISSELGLLSIIGKSEYYKYIDKY